MPLSFFRLIKLGHVHIAEDSIIRIVSAMQIAHISLRTKSKCLPGTERVNHLNLAPSVINLFMFPYLSDSDSQFHFNFIKCYKQQIYQLKWMKSSILIIGILNFYIYYQRQEQIAMYYTSKTQSFQQENFNPNQYYENHTISQGIVASDLALSKAIQIIQQLKQNLKYALKVNETLLSQNEQLKLNAERTTKKINSDAHVWESKLKEMQKQKEQIITLLEDSKLTLREIECNYQEAQLQIQDLNNTIYQQKKAYAELQQNIMNHSISYVGDSSLNVGRSDAHQIYELQRQKHDLEIQIKRLNQQIQKNEGKLNKLEKENSEFKRWMANALGLQKVIEGTEKILMKQINQRMLPA